MTLATSVATLVFLGLRVLDLGPMYATDRRQTDICQTSDRQTSLNVPRLLGVGHNEQLTFGITVIHNSVQRILNTQMYRIMVSGVYLVVDICQRLE